jgi:hypothetical protein
MGWDVSCSRSMATRNSLIRSSLLGRQYQVHLARRTRSSVVNKSVGSALESTLERLMCWQDASMHTVALCPFGLHDEVKEPGGVDHILCQDEFPQE